MDKDSYEENFEVENRINKQVGEKFAKAGIILFSEVTIEKAVEILDHIPREVILKALRTMKLPGRRVGKDHLIRVDYLYYWAIGFEARKIKEALNPEEENKEK